VPISGSRMRNMSFVPTDCGQDGGWCVVFMTPMFPIFCGAANLRSPKGGTEKGMLRYCSTWGKELLIVPCTVPDAKLTTGPCRAL